jgi:hypothetical protein
MPNSLVRLVTFLTLTLLILASHRVTRLIGWDTLTARWRARLTGYSDTGERNRYPHNRKTLGEFIHCPWCLGFWVSLAWYLAWQEWPQGTLDVAIPFAISSAVGLVVHNGDQ